MAVLKKIVRKYWRATAESYNCLNLTLEFIEDRGM